MTLPTCISTALACIVAEIGEITNLQNHVTLNLYVNVTHLALVEINYPTQKAVKALESKKSLLQRV